MKYASVNYKNLESEISNHLLTAVDPIQGAKYAMMMMCDNSEDLLKLAKVDHKLALAAAIGNFKAKIRPASGPGDLNDDVSDEDIPPETKEAVCKIAEFKDVDKVFLKRADRALAQAFPTFYKDMNGKLAFLLFATRPEIMAKTAFFRNSPSEFGEMVKKAGYYNAGPSAMARYGVPIAATAALTAGGMGLMSAVGAAKTEYNRMTAYERIVRVDPEIEQYPREKVQKAIDDLFRMAPDVMKNDTMAAHIVHQVVAAPPAGLSVDFADKLLKAQSSADPQYGGKAIDIFGPASKLVTKVLDIF